MSEYQATISWQRDEQKFTDKRYSRGHQWQFDGGAVIQASSSPSVVPLPWSVAENVDPEEAFVAALSSCHMLTFLALAAKAGWPVASYHDHVVAHLGKTPKGKMSVSRLDMHPVVRFDTGFQVNDADLAEMQHRAHRYCFIANTLADFVEINIH